MPTLEIDNPSDYRRPEKDRQEYEYVAVPWRAVQAADPGLTPANVGARGPDGMPLACEVLRRRAADEELVVRVEEPLPASTDPGAAPFHVELGSWGPYGDAGAQIEFEHADGAGPAPPPDRAEATPAMMESVVRVRMVNEVLNIWFDLGDHFGKEWFAGAAPSVRLKARELLDDYRTPHDRHDPEKRCMQIERVTVSRPGWETEPVAVYPLFGSRYALVDYACGPVGASITIASPPLAYDFADPFAGVARSLACRLFRRLSLYGEAGYVAEEVWMRGESDYAAEPVDLCFSARYFSYMEMGSTPHVSALPGIPGWRAISMRYEPLQGYGFATDAPTGAVLNPHPEYLDAARAHRTFSWEMGVCRGYRCVHLFHRSSPEEIEHHTGRAWYELVFEPLRVRIL